MYLAFALKMPAMFPVARYLVVLQPHDALCESIEMIKQKFAADYACPLPAAGRASVTLARFEQYEMQEKKIIHRLGMAAAAQPAFGVEIHGFGSLPSHSIYLEITTQSGMAGLVRSLRPMQQLMKIDKERKPYFITDPHIAIARNLLPWQYEKGWLALSNTHFSGRFVADHMVLLRKREGESRYSLVRRFEMLGIKETEPVQGALF